ncbi:MAG: pyridoxal phosphate-dependent aminotransferase [Myxococcota bacterium]|nr:pyridoxal phosphate-dependent aminotransferase [Myxococcota bacterium]
MKLSLRTESVPASATIAVTTKAAQLKAQGVDVVGFGAGQPDFDTPEHIRNAAKQALDDGWTRYTPTPGLPQMRQAVVDHCARYFDLDIEQSHVITSCGGKHSLYNGIMCLANPGDEVLLPSPYWVTYPVQIEMAGAKPVLVAGAPENGFRVTAEQLEAACTDKTKGLIINSPSNPTGAGYRREELEAIADLAERRDLWVISDEMYARLTYGDYKSTWFATLPGMFERTYTVYGVSKTYAMTGWRVGIGIGPKALVATMSRLQGQMTTNPAAMAQAGAIAALTQPEDFLAGWLTAFDARRQRMVEMLNAIDGVACNMPEGAFYAFPDLRGLLGRRLGGTVMQTDWDLINYLLEEAHVALVPGTPFGAPGFARLSYATSMEQIEKGVGRMADAFGRLT